MSNYNAKDDEVLARQLLVQKVSIPFTLVHNASPASVLVMSDEPSLLFFATQGVNNITSELIPNETATYTTSPNDASGILNALFVVNESVSKVVACQVIHRNLVNQSGQGAFLGSATGITTGAPFPGPVTTQPTSGGGEKIMVTIETGLNHTTTDVNATLEIEYTTNP